MFFPGYGYHGHTFEQTYICYPVSFIDKPHLESGDKIIMPPSALDRLATLHIDYPMLFELRNPSAERVSHCGVLEFVAEEGMVYMPYWMMENMLLQEGDTVKVKNVALPKGSYVKLQPHTKDFLDISNPKAMSAKFQFHCFIFLSLFMQNTVSMSVFSLETALRSFSCLTTGDSIMVAYNNKKYYIDIVETKPDSAISIIETDCEVDFAPPLDYKEPEKPSLPAPSKPQPQAQEAVVEPEIKFNPFTGTGRRLDGKQMKDRQPSIPSSTMAAPVGTKDSTASTSTSSSQQPGGKLVFGSRATPADKQKDSAKEKKEEQPNKEEPKFQAFTGKKYSLRG